jgi:ubiquinone/menaquinone biosynthesis C-methylase UbiE
LEVFQEISSEIARMALGSRITPAIPVLDDLARRQVAERTRLGTRKLNLKNFWRDYLVGRDGTLGIELMTAASAYRSLMKAQIRALSLSPGERTVDLGSGVGSFCLQLAESGNGEGQFIVYACDLIRPALVRGRARLKDLSGSGAVRLHSIECDLDRDVAIPLRNGSVNAVMASLILSYLRKPEMVLEEIRRILLPGGRLVASSLRRDADISKIFMDGLHELTVGEEKARLGPAQMLVGQAAPRFLNDAARLLDFEELGFFRFWDTSELVAMVEEAGFSVVAATSEFGDPPQAIVITAQRR